MVPHKNVDRQDKRFLEISNMWEIGKNCYLDSSSFPKNEIDGSKIIITYCEFLNSGDVKK